MPLTELLLSGLDPANADGSRWVGGVGDESGVVLQS